MKKRFLLVIFALWALSIACTTQAPNDLRRPKSIPVSVVYQLETNPDLIGSYSVGRIRQGFEWTEKGQWTWQEYILTGEGPIVCFGGYKKEGKFLADENHEWVIVPLENSECLKLQKKK